VASQKQASNLLQAEAGIRDFHVTGVQTCALPIYLPRRVTLYFIPVDISFAASTLILNKVRIVAQVVCDKNRISNPLHELSVFARSEERRVGTERRTNHSPADQNSYARRKNTKHKK